MRGRIVTSDAEIDAFVRRARALEPLRPRATKAIYREYDDKVVITLATGVEVAIPRTRIPGLEDATPGALEHVKILGPGSGLDWPMLVVSGDVLELIGDAVALPYWTDQLAPWMRTIGQKGGSVRSLAKARAARANGRLGGRPPVGQRRAAKRAGARTRR